MKNNANPMPGYDLEPSIKIKNLTKIFKGSDRPALHNITAHIKPGQITGLVGPDGAGKTTLLRHIAGLLNATSGSIYVLGQDILHHQDVIHDITGYMPQKFGLYEELSTLENLNLYADIFGLTAFERQSRFKILLNFTNLTAFQNRLAGRLSGGMKQKLGLCCALLRQPQILLLDEPSVGVDPLSRQDLWHIVKSMVEDGTTVIWSTAYLDEAELCDDVLALNEGRLIFKGKPSNLSNRVLGRVFISENLGNKKREVLDAVTQDNNVLDVMIRGNGIRVLLHTAEKKPNMPRGTPHIEWISQKPIFEDGFIDLLGGIKERRSKLADIVDHTDSRRDKPSISAQDLCKQFGDFTAAKDINFDVQPGEILGLLGPNGAGKSTTFKMLCGLLKPTKGSSLLLGQDLRHASAYFRKNLGYMAQKFSLYGNLTVMQNLNFFSGIYELKDKKRQKIIEEMIHTFALEGYLNSPAESLPLGFKQRLALACSLMHRPPVLFLDEPTSGVDPLTRREFWLHINGMVRKGTTVLVTTHFMDEAEYCDRIVLIYRGHIIAHGTPDDLKKPLISKKSPNPSFEETFIWHLGHYDKKAS